MISKAEITLYKNTAVKVRIDKHEYNLFYVTEMEVVFIFGNVP